MENIATYLVVCPHCGAVKRVAFSTIPWHKVNYTLWSDSRIESDEWCEAAWTQQCPACKHFFSLPHMQVEETQCEDTGALPYQTLKQAIVELSGSGVGEKNARMEAWWAYNKQYGDMDDPCIPDEEKEFNSSNMQWLVDYYIQEHPCQYSLVFELLRLLGKIYDYNQPLNYRSYDRFVEWKRARYKKHGSESLMSESLLSEESLKRSYKDFVNDKKDALQRPPRPFKR